MERSKLRSNQRLCPLLTATALLALLFNSALAGGLGGAVSHVPASTQLKSQDEQVYIVQLNEPSAITQQSRERSGQRWYENSMDDAQARPRFDPDSPQVRRHVDKLEQQQLALSAEFGLKDRTIYHYRYAFNGMAVRMTPVQAQKLGSHRGVQRVWADRVRKVSTTASPGFLGLLASDEGLRNGLNLTGENIIIGVIDSGITPGHPSFWDVREKPKPRLCRSSWGENTLLGIWLCRRFKEPRYESAFGAPPAHWRGICQAGPGFSASACNNKIIGARFYRDNFDATYPIDPNEVRSPRDIDGHGTHIASTAAGVETEATRFGRSVGTISGMAPRARVAVYKACWLEPGQERASCSVADLVLAIDDAVADGVDIINYSIGSLDDSLGDPDDLALLAAANEGVLSVVAAGNDGPFDATILSPGATPWVLTAGASTRTGQQFEEAIRIDAPANIADVIKSREASFSPQIAVTGGVSGDLWPADDGVIPVEGEDGTIDDACQPLINATDMAGKIALVRRGGCDFQDKIENVEAAGAIAAVVFSNQGDPVVMAGIHDSVGIPAIMVGQIDGELLLDTWETGSDVTVTLDKSEFLEEQQAGNLMGSFSGRGPNFADLN
ncbi:MAG: S8 family serine peptidase, partial [Gammaproteobacteria bacterium]